MLHWHAENMCDSGINSVIEQITEAIKELVNQAFGDLDLDKVPEIGHNEKDGYFVKDWDGIPDDVFDYIEQNFDSTVSDVVTEIDNQMSAIRDDPSNWEHILEEYVHYETYSEVEHERDCLQEKIDEYESEEKENPRITIDGIEFVWVPEHGVFISETGRTMKLTETADTLVSCGHYFPTFG